MWLSLGLLGAASLTPSSLAQQSHVSGMGLDWGAWRIKPIYRTSAGGEVHVQSFLSLAKTEATTGNNIVAVWYLRNETTPTDWTAKSWTTTDPAEAVKSVKLAMGIPDSEDANWELDAPLEIVPGQTPETEQDYEKGILISDPMYPMVATAPDSASLVQFLADVGYSVANITIDQSANCEPSVQLTTMATALEWGIAQPLGSEALEAAQVEGTSGLMASLLTCNAQPGTPPPPPPPTCTPSVGPWTTGPVIDTLVCAWVLVGSTTTPVAGGTLLTCNYEARHYFRQWQTATATRNNCTTYTCTQVNTGYYASPGFCLFTVPTGTPSPGCAVPPPCLGPASATVACATVPTPTGPQPTWNGWGPPCNPQ